MNIPVPLSYVILSCSSSFSANFTAGAELRNWMENFFHLIGSCTFLNKAVPVSNHPQLLYVIYNAASSVSDQFTIFNKVLLLPSFAVVSKFPFDTKVNQGNRLVTFSFWKWENGKQPILFTQRRPYDGTEWKIRKVRIKCMRDCALMNGIDCNIGRGTCLILCESPGDSLPSLCQLNSTSRYHHRRRRRCRPRHTN